MGEKLTTSATSIVVPPSACGSSKCILPIKNADTKNDSEFNMKDVLRPSRASATPPIVAPSTKFTDHVVDERVFATIRSSSLVMFGITAVLAGSKNAHMMLSNSSKG